MFNPIKFIKNQLPEKLSEEIFVSLIEEINNIKLCLNDVERIPEGEPEDLKWENNKQILINYTKKWKEIITKSYDNLIKDKNLLNDINDYYAKIKVYNKLYKQCIIDKFPSIICSELKRIWKKQVEQISNETPYLISALKKSIFKDDISEDIKKNIKKVSGDKADFDELFYKNIINNIKKDKDMQEFSQISKYLKEKSQTIPEKLIKVHTSNLRLKQGLEYAAVITAILLVILGSVQGVVTYKQMGIAEKQTEITETLSQLQLGSNEAGVYHYHYYDSGIVQADNEFATSFTFVNFGVLPLLVRKVYTSQKPLEGGDLIKNYNIKYYNQEWEELPPIGMLSPYEKLPVYVKFSPTKKFNQSYLDYVALCFEYNSVNKFKVGSIWQETCTPSITVNWTKS